MSEDCLTLNVWTPGLDDRRRPVMVWIHGGSFTAGSGASALYRGQHLAKRHGVVVITCNYRLGAIGFLAHPALGELTASKGDESPWRFTGAANRGLLDQLAVLEWVRDNVWAFGGDPDNVTAFGESAGAMSISTLLGSNDSAGLVHRAVIQSGPPVAVSAELAARRAQRLCALAGIDEVSRRELSEVPAELLVEAATSLGAETVTENPPLALTPVVDGLLLDIPTTDAIAGGRASGVPLLIGTNRDEMSFFMLGDPQASMLDDDKLHRRTARYIGPEAAAQVIDAYRAARSARAEQVSPPAIWNAVASDWTFRLPSLLFAEAQAPFADVFNYLFDWESPALDGMLGACHVLEVPFVFGTLENPVVAPLAGSGPEARALCEAMMAGWVAFARTGDPSCDELGSWPTYDQVERQTMILGRDRHVEQDPRSEERKVWAEAGAAVPAGYHA